MWAKRIVVLGMVVMFAAMLGRMGWVDWASVGGAGLMIAFVLVVIVVIVLCLATPFLIIGVALWLLAEVFDSFKADPLTGLVPTDPTPTKRAAAAPKIKRALVI